MLGPKTATQTRLHYAPGQSFPSLLFHWLQMLTGLPVRDGSGIPSAAVGFKSAPFDRNSSQKSLMSGLVVDTSLLGPTLSSDVLSAPVQLDDVTVFLSQPQYPAQIQAALLQGNRILGQRQSIAQCMDRDGNQYAALYQANMLATRDISVRLEDADTPVCFGTFEGMGVAGSKLCFKSTTPLSRELRNCVFSEKMESHVERGRDRVIVAAAVASTVPVLIAVAAITAVYNWRRLKR